MDIKPENILIDEEGNIWICDFGSSIRLNFDKYNFDYSFPYASPEILDIENSLDFDHKFLE